MGLIDEDLSKKISLSKKNELSIMSSYIDELVYDGLTKVYNRRSGIPKLSRMISSHDGYKVFSLCYIDINGLKKVNDELGHKYGDDLILTVVKVVKRNIREDDFVIRLGGDEFLIVFQEAGLPIAKNIIYIAINQQRHLILASMSMLFSIAPAEILKGDLHFGHWSKLAEDMGKPKFCMLFSLSTFKSSIKDFKYLCNCSYLFFAAMTSSFLLSKRDRYISL
ncbi:MAG: GGDEF domain-containing protein [Tissierellia bacterium]|nr:GGDEF domain-containing protein [Tissierellia bacterium]